MNEYEGGREGRPPQNSCWRISSKTVCLKAVKGLAPASHLSWGSRQFHLRVWVRGQTLGLPVLLTCVTAVAPFPLSSCHCGNTSPA